MKGYQQLTLAEREIIYGMLSQGKKLRRNIEYGNEYFKNEYLPCKAQKLADKRKEQQRYKAPLKSPHIFLYVRKHLRDDGWSPEVIAQHLVLGRKKRMKQNGRSVRKQSKIPEAVSIDLRPKIVARRRQIGHWETDNVIGKQTDKTALSVTIERVTRVTIITKLTDRKAATKTTALTNRLEKYANVLRRTLTADNGSENTNHQDITADLGMKVHFCHAYHSWEKGTVENTNGRIRRYIPKGVSIDLLPDEYISAFEDKLIRC